MTKRSGVLLGVASVLVLLVSATDSLGQRTRFLSTRPTISALPRSVDAPADNPLTDGKIALGKLLFWIQSSPDIATWPARRAIMLVTRMPRTAISRSA